MSDGERQVRGTSPMIHCPQLAAPARHRCACHSLRRRQIASVGWGVRNLTLCSAASHHYPTGTADIVAGTITYILTTEGTAGANSLDECDLCLLRIDARGPRA